jgi:hypothetical protein
VAFFGLFGKKREKEAELDINADLGLPNHEDLGFQGSDDRTDDLAVPIENRGFDNFSQPVNPMQRDTFPEPRMNNKDLLDKKDIDLIINKLDLINSRIETLNERITNMERFMTTDQRKRW